MAVGLVPLSSAASACSLSPARLSGWFHYFRLRLFAPFLQHGCRAGSIALCCVCPSCPPACPAHRHHAAWCAADGHAATLTGPAIVWSTIHTWESANAHMCMHTHRTWQTHAHPAKGGWAHVQV
eukprot:73480-Chlamydomonas_euryale.AAC.4